MNTTSGSGMYGNVGQSAYGAAKAAIANLTIITTLEMRRYGVTANAISPVAATRMTATVGAAADGPETWHRMKPGNSSPVVAYLVSDASGWLTRRGPPHRGQRRASGAQLGPRTGRARSASGERFEAGELDDGLRRLYGTLPAGLDAGATLGIS